MNGRFIAEGRAFLGITYVEFEYMLDRLVAQVVICREDLRQRLGNPDWNWNVVYCIGKGGYRPGVALSAALGIPLVSDMAKRQGGPEQSSDQPLEGICFAEHLCSLVELKPGMRVLLVEDLTESGITLSTAVARLEAKGIKSDDMTTCVIWHKPTSVFKPNICVKEVRPDPETGSPPYILKPEDRFENQDYIKAIVASERLRKISTSD